MIAPTRARMAACALALLTLPSASASAEMPADFDCYLVPGEPTCQDVRRAFGGSVPGLALDADAPELTIVLRDSEVALGRRYLARFAGRPRGSDEDAQFELTAFVPESSGHDRAIALVVALLQRGAVPFLEVRAPGTAEDGALRLEATASDAEASSADDDPSPWYLRPRVSGGYVNAGLEVVNVGAGLEVNYSDPQWRWRVDGDATYRYLDVSLGDSDLVGEFFAWGGRSVFARSLGGGFSFALFGGVRSQPNNNLALRGDAGIGAEWVLSPFLAANETNVGARVTVAGYADRYVTPNQEARDSRVFAEPAATVFGRMHTRPFDLEISATAGLLLDRPEIWHVGGELSATLRIADGLQLSVSGELLYRGGAIHMPADPSQIDPIATTAAGSDFGEVTVETQVALTWAIGNSLLPSQDQRWR